MITEYFEKAGFKLEARSVHDCAERLGHHAVQRQIGVSLLVHFADHRSVADVDASSDLRAHLSGRGAHMLSPRTMYRPKTTWRWQRLRGQFRGGSACVVRGVGGACSTPATVEKTRSWHSPRITLVVWSKPFSKPTMLRPSLVMTCTTLST